MPRATATFKHDDAVRAHKAFERMGMRLGEIITYPDGRVKYVPHAQHTEATEAPTVDSPPDDDDTLPEPQT